MAILQNYAPSAPTSRRGVKRGFHLVSSSQPRRQQRKSSKHSSNVHQADSLNLDCDGDFDKQLLAFANHCQCLQLPTPTAQKQSSSARSHLNADVDEQLLAYTKHYQYLQLLTPIAPRPSSPTNTQQHGHLGIEQGHDYGDAIEVSSLDSQGDAQPALLLHMLLGF
ncbi:hypothetical protein FI667_g9085, partial [Globisporangium splendens]